jgi:hypothetical protein
MADTGAPSFQAAAAKWTIIHLKKYVNDDDNVVKTTMV